MSPAPCSVVLSGAIGSKSPFINGTFDPTSPPEYIDDQLMYVNRNDSNIVAAYCKSMASWCVQPNTSKGTSMCYAFLKTALRLDECTSGSKIMILCNKANAQIGKAGMANEFINLRNILKLVLLGRMWMLLNNQEWSSQEIVLV